MLLLLLLLLLLCEEEEVVVEVEVKAIDRSNLCCSRINPRNHAWVYNNALNNGSGEEEDADAVKVVVVLVEMEEEEAEVKEEVEEDGVVAIAAINEGIC